MFEFETVPESLIHVIIIEITNDYMYMYISTIAIVRRRADIDLESCARSTLGSDFLYVHVWLFLRRGAESHASAERH